MSARGICPGCGAPIEFRVTTSVVAVCGFCQQVVARGDVSVEDLGKSNPVLQLPSAFTLGTVGRFREMSFTVVGRTQLKHALGGAWNEWYASLDTGRWAWIAEHQGRIAFMGEVSVGQAPGIRSLDAAEPGSHWLSGRGEFVVNERGIATVFAEEGELPWRAIPLERRAYVDLASPGGGFATLDFGAVGDGDQPLGPTRFFVGFEATVDELALAHPHGEPASGDAALPAVAASISVSCPSCQAPLTLRRPDDSRVVVCDHCGAGSSVDDHKKLAFLFPQTIAHQPQFPLGARARLDERVLSNAHIKDKGKTLDVEVVAFVVRSVVEDGERFTFEEYLLATAKDGFFWLVESDGQWSLFRSIATTDVVDDGASAMYRGGKFRLVGRSTPQVEQVMGELYWKVTIGDTSRATDYTRFTHHLTCEKTKDEVNWTYGFPVPRSELARVFGVALPLKTSSSSSGGSPFTSSYPGSSSYSASNASEFWEGKPGEVPQWLVWVIIIIAILFFLAVGDMDGGGGGHGSGGGGGGFSFGK